MWIHYNNVKTTTQPNNNIITCVCITLIYNSALLLIPSKMAKKIFQVVTRHMSRYESVKFSIISKMEVEKKCTSKVYSRIHHILVR